MPDSDNPNELAKPSFTRLQQWSAQRLEWTMKKISTFLRDRSGATAVTFALMLVPLLGMTGLAVDYTRASSDRSRLQGVADSAALAGASVFTGANKSAAEASARAYLRGNLGAEADRLEVGFDASNQRVTVSLRGETNTLFMKILARDKVNIGVKAEALAPLKPTSAEIQIGEVYGHWAKKVSVIVVRPGTTREVVLGTVTYEASDLEDLNNRGTGKTTMDPADGKITLGEYDKFYLRMEVKHKPCNIGRYDSNTSSRYVTCSPTRNSDYKNYDATYTTNNTAQSRYLFVGDTANSLKQLPDDASLEELLNCDQQWHFHGWEDGGGWDKQDFFYKIKAACKAVDGEYVRLTR